MNDFSLPSCFFFCCCCLRECAAAAAVPGPPAQCSTVIIADTFDIYLFFFSYFVFCRKGNDWFVCAQQVGGECRNWGADRAHPARSERRSAGATSQQRRLGQWRQQIAQSGSGNQHTFLYFLGYKRNQDLEAITLAHEKREPQPKQ